MLVNENKHYPSFLVSFSLSVFEYSICSQDRSICNGIVGNISNMDLYSMNHNNIDISGPTSSDDCLDHDDGNHFFANKCMPIKTLDNTDYMIVSSEEIIDILDLTNDEVEQILDDNMISSQDFDTLNTPKLLQSAAPSNRVPRINFATNLTKVASSSVNEHEEGKGFDMRPLETPTNNLDTATDNIEIVPELTDTSNLITMPVSVTKKKSGRTKGARQISMFFLVFCHELIPKHLRKHTTDFI